MKLNIAQELAHMHDAYCFDSSDTDILSFMNTFYQSYGSKFGYGWDNYKHYNDCYTRAWSHMKESSSLSDKRSALSAFLGMTGSNFYENSSLDKDEVLKRIQFAIEIAGLIGA